MTIEAQQMRKVEVLAPTEFAKEVTREILRQNATILKALLNPMVYMAPDASPTDLSKASVKAPMGDGDV